MTQAVVGLFYAPADAERAVADMLDGGFRREKLVLIRPGSAEAAHIEVAGSRAEHVQDMAIGAVAGGLLGAVLGTLVGMLVMALPGLGPAVMGGAFAAAISGAGVTMVIGALLGGLAGGVLGALTWGSITADQATVYERFVARGGALVLVEAEAAEGARAAEILHHDGAADAHDLEVEWRRAGRE